MEAWGGERRETEIKMISVSGAGEESVNCDYTATSADTIPRGFIDVCLVSCDIFIYGSSSRNVNVCLSVCLSVWPTG